jgi:hypothetical protein
MFYFLIRVNKILNTYVPLASIALPTNTTKALVSISLCAKRFRNDQFDAFISSEINTSCVDFIF